MAERPTHCAHQRPDGARCKARPRQGGAWCAFHDPARAVEQEQARKAGGKARSRKAAVLPAETPDAPLGTVQDVVAFLAATANRVAKGAIDVKVGNCLGLLCGQLLRALEKRDLEARLEALEAVLKQRNGDGKP